MKITKTIILDVDQYSLIQCSLDYEIEAFEKINDSHKYDEDIQKRRNILNLIDSAKSEVVYEKEN